MSKLNTQLSFKKLLLIGFLFVIVIAIPITIFLVQQQLQTRTQATPNTTLSFTPSTQSAEIGEGVDFDIIITPGNNQVTNIKFVIKFDPTKLSVSENSFTLNQASGLTILEGPIVGTDTISAALVIGSDPTKVIQSDTNLGTITFDVVGGSALPTEITFDPTTEIRSTGGGDGIYENVFLSGTPASITILGGEEQNITPVPTLSPTPETSASPTPAGNGLSEIPVCSGIGMDIPAAGIAPYTIEFTVSGTDLDGTIESVSMDFGDDNFEEITSGGGISTNAIAVLISHTFETPGDYTVSAILTDDTGETSDTNSCTAAVTITDESGNTTVDNETDETEETNNTKTTQDESYNELTPTLAPTGPTETIMGIGALGAVLFAIGALLFFAL